MSNLRYKGFTYQLIIKPYKKTKCKIEVIKYVNGFRNLWERISYTEYKKIKNEYLTKNIK